MAKRLKTKSDVNYWDGRLTELLYNKSLSDTERRLIQQYQKALAKALEELERIYNEYLANSEGGIVLVSDLYKFDKYYELIQKLEQTLNKLGKMENAIISDELKNFYQSNVEMIGSSIAFGGSFNEDVMMNTLNSIWCEDGKHWSSRIWDDKAGLQQKLLDGLTDIVVNGSGKEKLVMSLAKEQLRKNVKMGFDMAYRNADRIVRTELAFIQNKSAIDEFKAAGIEYYKVLPAHDAKVCSLCKSLENKIFPIDDLSHMPPIGTHPNCRCAIIAVLD